MTRQPARNLTPADRPEVQALIAELSEGLEDGEDPLYYDPNRRAPSMAAQLKTPRSLAIMAVGAILGSVTIVLTMPSASEPSSRVAPIATATSAAPRTQAASTPSTSSMLSTRPFR